MPSWSEARLRTGTAESRLGDCKRHEAKRKADQTGELGAEARSALSGSAFILTSRRTNCIHGKH
jgi:hypothetical protein